MTPSQTPFLRVSGVTKNYRAGGETVAGLRPVSFELGRGDRLALAGPSGSGKSTLLHILAGLYRPTAGAVQADGSSLLAGTPQTEAWRAAHVGYVFQIMNLLPDFSVEENLLIAGQIAGVPREQAKKRGAELLDRLGLSDKRRLKPRALSLGESQRAAIARALISDPELILADEPTASLDGPNSQTVLDCLTELCGKGSALVVASHDENLLSRFPRRLVLSKDGPRR
ncbi:MULTISPECIES: ABC transporter ATP-binding protein [Jonquetella]|uniref:ABC-type antimicrobial peptide transport system, ATPase component n=1 Tax=Jonquetella anthropi DSM 22815 TaxID=885272 RepID=H0UIY3_9BACT|nr:MULTISPECIES: ABC transporter ATP-binding protein [Jonquetella]EEX49012.1 ABC transporter, ATP-binding protein [Jonquetella anthropi E3_33 E1]EHM12777.1 ABC-type antimicrobial peptide transport system, ATPase component [Jonquetella anthropi DSM 22815]ERL23430.1 ABC transporter, ATP-binding protein [Jonquetella sp. BV3C21]